MLRTLLSLTGKGLLIVPVGIEINLHLINRFRLFLF